MLGEKSSQSLLFSAKGWSRLADKVKQITGEYHQRFPLRMVYLREELRSKLKTPAPNLHRCPAAACAEGYSGGRRENGASHSHHVHLSKDQETTADAFLKSLTRNPYSPPGESEIDPEILDVLIEQRQVVKVAEHIIFAASAYDEMVERITSYMKNAGQDNGGRGA